MVTGAGAPHGIGLAYAMALADAGGDVILTDRDDWKLAENVEKVRKAGTEVHCTLCDNTDRSQVEALRDFALDKFGRIDVLINNAAAFGCAPAEEMSFEDWRRVMSVNLDGNFHVTQVIGREMIKQKAGSIIFTSSKSGVTVDIPHCQIGYNTSKAGIIMMAKSFAVEWAQYGIRVNVISPGNIIADSALNMMEEKHPWLDAWKDLNPMKRLGRTDELGNAAIFLASDASSYMTGANVLIDGGYCVI